MESMPCFSKRMQICLQILKIYNCNKKNGGKSKSDFISYASNDMHRLIKMKDCNTQNCQIISEKILDLSRLKAVMGGVGLQLLLLLVTKMVAAVMTHKRIPPLHSLISKYARKAEIAFSKSANNGGGRFHKVKNRAGCGGQVQRMSRAKEKKRTVCVREKKNE